MSAKILPGLCSVTFRAWMPARVVEHARQAGVRAIEWGGDVHVPPGDTDKARAARELCATHGVEIPSYGSYLMAGHSGSDEIEAALQTAVELGAPNVRIWAQLGCGPDAPAEDRAGITGGVREIAQRAAARGRTVSLEFHPMTLTETAESTLRIFDEVTEENLFVYWQPVGGDAIERSLAELRAVTPYLSHLHVFSWDEGGVRRPLEALAGMWRRALEIGAAAPSAWAQPRYAFLEFVRDDTAEQFAADAATLRSWLESA